MQYSSLPPKFSLPWASGAGTAYIRAIPTASQISVTPGAASLTDGFPPLNSQPVAAGGVPPFMQDFNGILNQSTAWLQWVQAGAPVIYDATFANAIGGYPKGALLQSSALNGVNWLSTVDNNTANPDAGGAGWTMQGEGRLINIQSFLSPGTYTYTKSAGVNAFVVTVVGGGGAGGGAAATNGAQYSVGSGGGAGSVGVGRYPASSPVTVVVGSGGTGVVGLSGGYGTASSFGTLISAPGGAPGQSTIQPTTVTAIAGQGVSGATAVGGNIFNGQGQPGACGFIIQEGGVSGQGGASYLGGGAGNTSNTAGGAGSSPGSGGGGSGTTTNSPAYAGGNGAPGAVIVWEYS